MEGVKLSPKDVAEKEESSTPNTNESKSEHPLISDNTAIDTRIIDMIEKKLEQSKTKPLENRDSASKTDIDSDGNAATGTPVATEGANTSQSQRSPVILGTGDADTSNKKVDSSAFDMSWLNGSEETPSMNIADLSFEQFQMLYYQHLFRNTAPSDAKRKKTAKATGEVPRKVSKPPTNIMSGNVTNSTASTTPSTSSAIDQTPDRSPENAPADSALVTDLEKAPDNTQSKQAQNAGLNFTCDPCNKTFKSRLELTSHDKRVHSIDWDSDLQCKTCNKKFSSKYYLNQHELIHKGDLPFLCEHCDKRFLCKGTLDTHVILLHTEERPHKCEECGAAFKLKKILMRHVATHTNETPFQCPNCDKCFSRRGSLSRHELTHTGEKPFTCDLCNKSFTQKSSLNSHKMAHANERPFQCTKCNKRFCKKSHLNRHDAVHTGKKKYYECKQCTKCFAEKYCLLEHEKTHAANDETVEK